MNKLEQLKKKMEEAQIAHAAAFEAALDAARDANVACNARAALDAARDANVAARTAYNKELNKNNDNT